MTQNDKEQLQEALLELSKLAVKYQKQFTDMDIAIALDDCIYDASKVIEESDIEPVEYF